jgi:hypothetical protein
LPHRRAFLVTAILNWYWYGAAWRSGYGRFDELFALERVVPNLAAYLPNLEFEVWQNLRFLLPGYPPRLVGVGMVAAATVERAGRAAGAALAATLIVAAVAMSGWDLVRREGLPGYAMHDASFSTAAAACCAGRSSAPTISIAR